MAAPCRRCETAFFPSQPLAALPASTWRSYLDKYIRIDWLILNDFHGFQIERQRRSSHAPVSGAFPTAPLPCVPSGGARPAPASPWGREWPGLSHPHLRGGLCACEEACSLPQLRVPNLFSFTCSVSVLRSTHLYFTVSWLAQRLVAVVCNVGTRKAVCH